jgi:hypothetical protein
MGVKLLKTISLSEPDQTSNETLTYRIDPEIASYYIGTEDPSIDTRQAEFWDSVGPEYADLARNIGCKVALLRRTSGDAVAEAYREAATSILESLKQQDELERKLES